MQQRLFTPKKIITTETITPQQTRTVTSYLTCGDNTLASMPSISEFRFSEQASIFKNNPVHDFSKEIHHTEVDNNKVLTATLDTPRKRFLISMRFDSFIYPKMTETIQIERYQVEIVTDCEQRKFRREVYSTTHNIINQPLLEVLSQFQDLKNVKEFISSFTEALAPVTIDFEQKALTQPEPPKFQIR